MSVRPEIEPVRQAGPNLSQARTDAEGCEAVNAALASGIPLREIEDDLDWQENRRPSRESVRRGAGFWSAVLRTLFLRRKARLREAVGSKAHT